MSPIFVIKEWWHLFTELLVIYWHSRELRVALNDYMEVNNELESVWKVGIMPKLEALSCRDWEGQQGTWVNKFFFARDFLTLGLNCYCLKQFSWLNDKQGKLSQRYIISPGFVEHLSLLTKTMNSSVLASLKVWHIDELSAEPCNCLFQNLYNFLAQPNSLTHLDISGTDTALETVR
jgi:hypothetical protein